MPLVGRLRLSEVVAAGHSFGAVTAMVAAEVRAPTPTHLRPSIVLMEWHFSSTFGFFSAAAVCHVYFHLLAIGVNRCKISMNFARGKSRVGTSLSPWTAARGFHFSRHFKDRALRCGCHRNVVPDGPHQPHASFQRLACHPGWANGEWREGLIGRGSAVVGGGVGTKRVRRG